VIRRLALSAVLGLLLVAPLATPASSLERTGDDTVAVAVNTDDGTSLLRLAFSVRRVADGTVDQTNTAVALASCADCVTVALAFQVVLVTGDADLVVPENGAFAVNVACAECFTYASATQLVFGFEGPVRLTSDGARRLTALQRSLRELQASVDTMTEAEILTAVAEAKQELLSIYTSEVVEPAPPEDPAADPSTTSSSSTSSTTSSSTSTTSTSSTSTSSTSTTSTTTPTTTTSDTTP
jgi:putative peptide zinc metalloprotease protein